MKRGTKSTLRGFLTRMRNERKRCISKGHYARARQIKVWLKAHVELMGAKNAA